MGSGPEKEGHRRDGKTRVASEDLELLYLLNHGNVRRNTEYLSRIISEDKSKVGDAVRVRAINWLLQISPPPLVKQLTGIEFQELKSQVRILDYMTQLRDVNFHVRSKELRNSDRTSVISTLVTQQASNGRALKIAARMCLDFDVDDGNIWTIL